MIKQAPRIDGGIVGKDASFEGLVNGVKFHPPAARRTGAAKLVRAAQLGAVERSRIAIALAIPRSRRVIGQRGQCGLFGIERSQTDVNARSLRRVLAEFLVASELEPIDRKSGAWGK